MNDNAIVVVAIIAIHEYNDDNDRIVSNTDVNEFTKRTSGFEQLKPDENEPNLYLLPAAISPVYRSMPFLTKACIGTLSAVISIRWHIPSMIRMKNDRKHQHCCEETDHVFMFKFVTVSLISTLAVA